MKNFLLLFTVLFITTVAAQKATIKLPGINTSVVVTTKDVIDTIKTFDLDVKIPKTEQQQIGKAEKTANTAIYKSVNYPVYTTSKGKLFIVYPNKEGTGYNKKYIKEDTKIK